MLAAFVFPETKHVARCSEGSKAGFLRLCFPSTHTGFRSPLARGLPRPVRSAFRVSFYPLSGFLLPESSEPSFRSKRSWDSLLQSFPPSDEPSPSRGSVLSCPLSTQLTSFKEQHTPRRLDSRALLPSKSRIRQSRCYTTAGNPYSPGVTHL